MDYQASKVDKTFDKIVAELDRYSKVFRKGGQLERATAEIGGDIAWFNDIRGKLDDLIDTVNDAHMYAMMDHVDMGESVNEAAAKIACLKCDEVSTAAAWKKNDGFCPKCKTSSQGVAESKAVKGKKLTEGVLDDGDEDGFMARSQLYFLAKDSIALHGMIDDRDDLEPWVHTKIVAASEGIEAVRRYMEYRDVVTPDQAGLPAEQPDMEMEEGWETLPAYDKEKYQERPGLEGPFQTRVGKVVYYDPKQGAYYDPTSDTYLSYDEWKALDMPDTPLRNETVAEAANRYVDIMGGDLPNGIDYDFNNLPKVKWSQYSREEIAQFVDSLRNLDFEDEDGNGGAGRAARWVEKNVLAKKKVAEAAERPYVCVHAKKGKHSCTAGSSYEAAKKAAKAWGLKSTAGIDAHLADVEKVAEGMDFDDKRNGDLKQIAADMFAHAKKAAAKKVK